MLTTLVECLLLAVGSTDRRNTLIFNELKVTEGFKNDQLLVNK